MLAERLLLDGAVGCARMQSLAAERSARGWDLGVDDVALGRASVSGMPVSRRAAALAVFLVSSSPLPAAARARLLQGFGWVAQRLG
jgi:hypothetical protein